MNDLSTLTLPGRSDESFRVLERLAPAEKSPVPVAMTAEEIVAFEADCVIWSQKIDATDTTPPLVILWVVEIGIVRAATYRKAIEKAAAMLREANS